MTEEKFFKLLEKRLNLFEMHLERKLERLNNTTEDDTTEDIYMDISNLGINYMRDIKLNFLELELAKSETRVNSWFDPEAQYYYLDDSEKTLMKVKSIDRDIVRLESESGSKLYHGSMYGLSQLLGKIISNKF